MARKPSALLPATTTVGEISKIPLYPALLLLGHLASISTPLNSRKRYWCPYILTLRRCFNSVFFTWPFSLLQRRQPLVLQCSHSLNVMTVRHSSQSFTRVAVLQLALLLSSGSIHIWLNCISPALLVKQPMFFYGLYAHYKR